MVLSEQISNFKSEKWAHNGPVRFTATAQMYCNSSAQESSDGMLCISKVSSLSYWVPKISTMQPLTNPYFLHLFSCSGDNNSSWAQIFLSSSKVQKIGQNCPNISGTIWSLSLKFQIWGWNWPSRPLNLFFFCWPPIDGTSTSNNKPISSKFLKSSLKSSKVLKNLQEILLKS